MSQIWVVCHLVTLSLRVLLKAQRGQTIKLLTDTLKKKETYLCCRTLFFSLFLSNASHHNPSDLSCDTFEGPDPQALLHCGAFIQVNNVSWRCDLFRPPGSPVIRRKMFGASLSRGSNHRKEETEGQMNENIPPGSFITGFTKLWPATAHILLQRVMTSLDCSRKQRAQSFWYLRWSSSWNY